MRRLRWTAAAADDLESISDYLHRNQPSWAQATVKRLYETASALRTPPLRGRPGTEPGTRELMISGLPYIIVFTVSEEAVEILHIFHGAQNWLQ